MDTWKNTIVCCKFCNKPLPRAEVKIHGKNVAVCENCINRALGLLTSEMAKDKVTREYEEEVKRRNWRRDPITEKQRQFISAASQEYKEFHGTTKGEAYDYIQEFLEYDKERKRLEAAEAEADFESLNG